MGSILRRLLLGALISFVFLASACTTTRTFEHDVETEVVETPVVLLMPVDVELSLLTAGGMLEPRADWTEAAIGFIEPQMRDILGESQASLVHYAEPDDPERQDLHRQISKLHELVGGQMFAAKLPGAVPLPTMRDRFDWTLGEGAQVLAEDSGADYALFVFVRDSYASAGRQALIVAGVLAGAVTGVAIIPSAGQQLGFASLIDLRDGNVRWFNFVASETGDFRKEKSAKKSTLKLLEELPF